jgi:signal transduction histidine kinase
VTVFTALVFLAGFFEVALCLAILRAAPECYDNRVFAGMGLLEGGLQVFRGFALIEGNDLVGPTCMQADLLATIVLGYLTLCFAYSFPFSRSPPRRFLAPVMAFAGVALALSLHPATTTWFGQRSSYLYFLPVFVYTLWLLWRNSRRLTRREPFGVHLVMVGLAFRWGFGMFTYLAGPPLGEPVFRMLVDVHATGAVLAGQIIMSYAIFRSNLFRLHIIRTSLVMWGGLGAGVLALLTFAADLAVRTIGAGSPSRALLVLVGLGPVALLGVGIWLRPQLYSRVLFPLDRRFAQRRTVLARATERLSREVEPERLLAEIRVAISEMTRGGDARLFAGPDHPDLPGASGTLGASLGAYLAAHPETHFHRDGLEVLPTDVVAQLDGVGAEILVPVRRGSQLFGSLALVGGVIDREAVMTATVLAEQLALKLENYWLFAAREKLEAELAESRRLASLGSFAAAIAHEIRTPLTSIQMNVQILQSKSALPPQDMEYFDIAQVELRRLDRYIGEILDYAKPLQIHRLPSDLREIADETARSLEPLLRERKVTLARDHDPGLPSVPLDAGRMRQVLVNLLDNAANASVGGGEVLVRTRTEGDRVVLEVVDHGKGISTDDLPKIFEPFFTTRPDGTGLGLAISQKIVRAHGAELVAESRAGEGATFRVVFPAAQAA